MIGRFTSPDTIVPNPAYPQSLNRYSYCLNNPLRWIDPSGHENEGLNPSLNPDIDPATGINWGHDTETGIPCRFTNPLLTGVAYVFVGGSNQTDSSAWVDIAAGLGISIHDVVFVPDPDKDNPLAGDDCEVGPRMAGLVNALNQLEGFDIHIIGFSEGAAALGTLLNQITYGESGLSAAVIDCIRTATLLEVPYGAGRDNSAVIEGWNHRWIDNLPYRLGRSNDGSHIRLFNVFEESSQIQQCRVIGWPSRSIDTGSAADKLIRFGDRAGKIHNRVLHDPESISYIVGHIKGY